MADFNAALPADWRGQAAVPLDPDTVFNGYVAANVIYALDQIGLLDALADGPVQVAEYVRSRGAAPAIVAELVRVAGMLGYLDGDATIRLTDAGRSIAAMRGYFTWSVGGYSAVFAAAGPLAAGAVRYGEQVVRDDAMVGRGSGQNDESLMAGLLDEALTDVAFDTVADLGSGVCTRLCRVVAGRPDTRGIGVDLSAAATGLATSQIADAKLADRVSAVRGDVLDMLFAGGTGGPSVSDVDAVMSFFLLHDLLANPDRRTEVLPRLREAFPAARTFILADTMLRPGGGDSLPIFSAGYELAHALMGVPLHTRDTYEKLFAASGLRTRRVVPFGTPYSWLYVLDAD